MVKKMISSISVAFILLLLLAGCDRTKVYCRYDALMDQYFEKAEAAVHRFYPSSGIIPSPMNKRKDPKKDDYFREEVYSLVTPEEIGISYEAYFSKTMRSYYVTMTRTYEKPKEKGFDTKSLTLFCELANLIPLAEDVDVSRAFCRDFINEKSGCETNNSGFRFVLEEREMHTGHNLNLEYTLTDGENGFYTEVLYCESVKETDYLFPFPYS